MADHRIPGEHIFENMVLEEVQTEENVRRVMELEAVEGDVLVASYPKTGTTWMSEIVWLLQNNADVTGSKSKLLIHRVPFLEHIHYAYDGKAGIQLLEDMPRPAVMKTHLKAQMFERALTSGRVKVVVPIRNPKDTLVSLYHFYQVNKGLGNFAGTWNEFFELYKVKHLLFGDYFDWYDSWLQYADRPNVQFFVFEDMKARPKEAIGEMSAFLGRVLTEKQIDAVVRQTSFSTMKDNKMSNMDSNPEISKDFIRKGEIGDWKNYFSQEQSDMVDNTYRERLLKKGISLRFE